MRIIAKKNLTDIRIKKGLSITGLANAMEVNPSVTFKMENGHAVRPATAKKACIALNEAFDTLFTIETQNNN